jgi:hypothetical protein
VLDSGACVVVSAGSTYEAEPEQRRLYLSARLRSYVDRLCPAFAQAMLERPPRPHEELVHVLPALPGRRACPVAAVTPWRDPWTRDILLIGDGTVAALAWARAEGYERVHMALLGAGRMRHFPASVSLVEIVRGFRRARHADPATPRLVIHVVDEQAVFELTSGRLDVVELLTSGDIRFWAEVPGRDGEIERELLFQPETATVSDVVAECGLGVGDWSVELDPSPVPGAGGRPLRVIAGQSIREVGVIPGGTVRFVAALGAPGEPQSETRLSTS